MSEMVTLTSFYHVGGTMKPDAPSYVERTADHTLYDALHAGKVCYTLTSRQMGKSSLVARVSGRLKANGVAVARLDLQKIGKNLTAEQWYSGLLLQLGKELKLGNELLDAFWKDQERTGPLQRWLQVIREVALERVPGPVVVFIDEIDYTRSLDFSTDEFFGGIRELYNRRAYDPELERLTFCLVGVAAPSDLIRDARTSPFNIGQRIELTDFTEAEGEILRPGLERPAEEARGLLTRILYWTGGQPFLTQRLCQSVAENAAVHTPEDVDSLCASLYFSVRARSDDNNLNNIRERMLNTSSDPATVLDIYDQIRKGNLVRDDQSSPPINALRLSGVVRVANGYLCVRNRIYERVFDHQWVVNNMPDAELRRQKAAVRLALIKTISVAALFFIVVTGLLLFAWQKNRDLRKTTNDLRKTSDALSAKTKELEGTLTRLEGQKKIADEEFARANAARGKFKDATLLLREEALRGIDNESTLQQALISISSPEEGVSRHDSLAGLQLQQGNHEAAMEEANKALETAPNYPHALESRGYAYLLSGHPKEALADYEHILSVSTYSVAMQNLNKTIALANLGQHRDAEKSLALSIQAATNGRDINYYEAEISEDIVRATGRPVLEGDSEAFLTGLHYLRANLEAYVGGKQFVDNLEQADRWVERQKFLRKYVREGGYLAALEWAYLQQKQRPVDIGTRAIGGALWERLGELDWAACYYTKFESEQAKHAQARYSDLASWVQGRLSEIQPKVKKSCQELQAEETDARSPEMRAREAAANNHFEQAEALYTKALESEPNNPNLILQRARLRSNWGWDVMRKWNQAKNEYSNVNTLIKQLQEQIDKQKQNQTQGLTGSDIKDQACKESLNPDDKMKCLQQEVQAKKKAADRLEKEYRQHYVASRVDCTQILNDLKRPMPMAYFYRGLAARRLSSDDTLPKDALDDFREVLRHDPDNSSALDWVSYFLAKEDDDKKKLEALEMLEHYNFLYPGSADTLSRIADLMIHFNRFAEAQQAIETAITMAPVNTAFFETRAKAERGLGVSEAQIAREQAQACRRAADILRLRGNRTGADNAMQAAMKWVAPQADQAGNEIYQCDPAMTTCMVSRTVKVNAEFVVAVIESMVPVKQDAVPGITSLDRVRIVKVDRGSDDGLLSGMQGELYAVYSSKDKHVRDSLQIGRSEVIDAQQKTALVRVTMSNPSGDGLVRQGDMVALRARTPKVEKRSPFWWMARFHVTLTNVEGKVDYADYRKFYADESPALVEQTEQQMLAELHTIPPRLDATVSGAKLVSGPYKGKTVGEVIGSAQKSDLDQVFAFLMRNTGIIAGRSFSFPFVFRTWVEIGKTAQ